MFGIKQEYFYIFLTRSLRSRCFLKATLRGLATAPPLTGFASHLLYFLDPGKGSKSCPTDFGDGPLCSGRFRATFSCALPTEQRPSLGRTGQIWDAHTQIANQESDPTV